MRYGKDITQFVMTAYGYDGANSIIAAMLSQGTESEQIKNGLYAIKSLPGTLGPLTFTANGSSPRYESVFIVKDGKETFFES